MNSALVKKGKEKMMLPYMAHSLLSIPQILTLPHITLPLASIAGTPAAPTTPTSGSASDPFADLESLVTFLQGFVFWLGLSVFVIGVVIAGIMRMVAFGSERRIATSNIALTAAVVGLVIMLAGQGLLTVLQNIFPNPGMP